MQQTLVSHLYTKKQLMSEDLFDLSSVDSVEMQHDAAFLLGLQCLQKYSFRGFPKYKGLIY